jgi:hypothetical protein
MTRWPISRHLPCSTRRHLARVALGPRTRTQPPLRARKAGPKVFLILILSTRVTASWRFVTQRVPEGAIDFGRECQDCPIVGPSRRKSGHICYAPKATRFRIPAKWRDWPKQSLSIVPAGAVSCSDPANGDSAKISCRISLMSLRRIASPSVSARRQP